MEDPDSLSELNQNNFCSAIENHELPDGFTDVESLSKNHDDVKTDDHNTSTMKLMEGIQGKLIEAFEQATVNLDNMCNELDETSEAIDKTSILTSKPVLPPIPEKPESSDVVLSDTKECNHHPSDINQDKTSDGTVERVPSPFPTKPDRTAVEQTATSEGVTHPTALHPNNFDGTVMSKDEINESTNNTGASERDHLPVKCEVTGDLDETKNLGSMGHVNETVPRKVKEENLSAEAGLLSSTRMENLIVKAEVGKDQESAQKVKSVGDNAMSNMEPPSTELSTDVKTVKPDSGSRSDSHSHSRSHKSSNDSRNHCSSHRSSGSQSSHRDHRHRTHDSNHSNSRSSGHSHSRRDKRQKSSYDRTDPLSILRQKVKNDYTWGWAFTVQQDKNGRAFTLHLYPEDIPSKLKDSEIEALAKDFIKCSYSEAGKTHAHFVMGIVHNGGKHLPELLDHLADHYPQLQVNCGQLKSPATETKTISECREDVYRTYANGTFRSGPINEVSLVGTRGEEAGGYFPDLIKRLEASPFLKPVMPWGEFSAVKMETHLQSNDGPIYWCRPGEQLVPASSRSQTSLGRLQKGAQRPYDERATHFEDRTKPHGDHSGNFDNGKAHPVNAVGLVKAVTCGQTTHVGRITKEVIAFSANQYETLIDVLQLDTFEPPQNQCHHFIDTARLNCLAYEGVTYAKISLKDSDLYYIPRKVIHQFQSISAVSSIAWHIQYAEHMAAVDLTNTQIRNKGAEYRERENVTKYKPPKSTQLDCEEEILPKPSPRKKHTTSPIKKPSQSAQGATKTNDSIKTPTKAKPAEESSRSTEAMRRKSMDDLDDSTNSKKSKLKQQSENQKSADQNDNSCEDIPRRKSMDDQVRSSVLDSKSNVQIESETGKPKLTTIRKNSDSNSVTILKKPSEQKDSTPLREKKNIAKTPIKTAEKRDDNVRDKKIRKRSSDVLGQIIDEIETKKKQFLN